MLADAGEKIKEIKSKFGERSEKKRNKEKKPKSSLDSLVGLLLIIGVIFMGNLDIFISIFNNIINNLNQNLGDIKMSLYIILAGVFVLVLIFWSAVKIVQEYERGVIFRLGRLIGAKGPGLFFIIPIIDRMVLVDLRVVAMDVDRQNVITEDNVSIGVDAVIYYRVENPNDAIVKVEHYALATLLLAQTTLRDILGQVELDDILGKRDELNKRIQAVIDEATNPWGIKVTAVTIKDVILHETMMRAIAKQAEAERERRSRIIMADGEFKAAEKMKQAAELYQESPLAIKLREFQNLAEIAREKNLIIVPSSEMGMIAGVAKGVSRK